MAERSDPARSVNVLRDRNDGDQVGRQGPVHQGRITKMGCGGRRRGLRLRIS